MSSGSLFYYVTYKYVLLKDARLGLLYYVLALLTVLYTVVEIFIRKGYMEFDTHPLGTVNLLLSDDFANEGFTAADLPYCKGDVPCLYLDPWDLNWPRESRAVTITTFAKDRIQRRNSSSNSPRDEYEQIQEKVYYTQAPESVVIKLDHAVVATKFTDRTGRSRLAASHRQLKGYLVNSDGQTMKELSTGKSDKVTILELLEAAGIESLDQTTDAIDGRGRTYRQRGCILRVVIFYQNWFSTWIGTADPEYRYYVHHVPYSEYSSKQVDPLMEREEVLSDVGVHQAQWRLLRKRYSIRIEFEQAGSLGLFSLPTLLLKLVSGMGLLTLTATAIDTLALYILPNRRKYRECVYDESPALKQDKKNE